MEQHPEAIDLDSKESLNLEGGRTVNLMSSSKLVERLKRILVKFIVSICVFSLGLAFIFPFFFSHSFNHALERKYMFLICNGILFLLATSSVNHEEHSSSSSSSLGTCNYSFSHSDADQFDQPLMAAIDESNSEEEEEEEQNQDMEIEEEVGEVNGGELEEELDEECFTEEEEEEEEEEQLGKQLEVVVSTEELNKKIEEFIRKMKEEMRVEAPQTQLILV